MELTHIKCSYFLSPVDTNECDETSACHNGGVCNNIVGSYMCICTTGFTGLMCESGRMVLVVIYHSSVLYISHLEEE